MDGGAERDGLPLEPPRLMHTAVQAVDPRGLAEFYRRLLGLRYRPGDEPPSSGVDDADWLVLVDPRGRRVLAIQGVDELARVTWPSPRVPMQAHQDFAVADLGALRRHWRRAEGLGARVLFDRTDDQDEPLVVLADPQGHPFCLLVAPAEVGFAEAGSAPPEHPATESS